MSRQRRNNKPYIACSPLGKSYMYIENTDALYYSYMTSSYDVLGYVASLRIHVNRKAISRNSPYKITLLCRIRKT
jgi:hypothetical protein